MAGKLSSQAQMKMATLQTMLEKVQHVYSQVERYAGTRDPGQAELLAPPLKRALGKLKLDLMGAGLDTLSQLAGAMEIAAGRGGSQRQKSRILREGIGSLRFQVEQEQRKLVTEDQALQRRQAEAEAKAQARAKARGKAESEGRAEPESGGS